MPKTSPKVSISQGKALLGKNIPQAYWPGLFPLCPPDCQRHSQQFPICPSPGKTPQRKGYTKTAEEQYEKAFLGELPLDVLGDEIAKWIVKGHNLGLVPPPNTVVVDADDAHGVQWVRKHAPKTAVQSRSKESEHTWFQFDPEEWPARNKSYKLDLDGERSQVDLRCPGKGFVVVPPSVHKDGKPYKWKAKLPDKYTDLPMIPDQIKDPFRPYLTDRVKPRPVGQAVAGHDLILRYVNRLCRYESGVDVDKALDSIRKRASSYAYEVYEGREDRAKEMCREGGELDSMVESGWELFGARTPLDEDASDQAIVSLLQVEFAQPWVHVEELSKNGWKAWDGTVWRKSSPAEVRLNISAFADVLFEDALREEDIDRRDRLMKMAKQLRNHRKVVTVFNRMQDSLHVSIDQFDSDPWLLTFPASEDGSIEACTLNLRDMTMRPPDPDDWITQLMGAPFNVEAQSDLFETYLDTSLPDREVRDWVQRAMGCSMPGMKQEEVFFFLHGLGGSGKGLLLGTACEAFGDYGHMCQPGTFSGDGPLDGSKAEPDVMALKGKRFIFLDEISDVRKIGARMKNLTGGSKVSARALYGSTVTFKPQHSVWLAGNQQPRANAEDSGIWRRAKEIPMNAGSAVETTKPVESIKERLVEEEHLTAFVAWMVKGAEAARREGWRLGESAKIQEATEAFRDASDPIGEWFSENLEPDPTGAERIPKSDMFAHYEKWTDDQYGISSRMEVPRANQKQMTGALRRRGLQEKKVRGVRCWAGVRFIEPEGAPSAPDFDLGAPKLKH